MVPGTEAWLLGREGRRSAWVLYIIFDYINYPPTPLAAAGARQRRNYQSLQAARARSNKTRKKKQEARSGYRQQAARSKKLEARKQQAAGRQVRKLVFLSIQKVRQAAGRQLRELVFLVRQSEPWPAGPVRPSKPCFSCSGSIRSPPFVSLDCDVTYIILYSILFCYILY